MKIVERSLEQPASQDDGDDYSTAMARAGRLLATRARAIGEMRDRLTRAGFQLDVVERVVGRLTELGLLDDDAFARQWVAERSGRRGGAALVAELQARGVDRAVAENAVGAAGLDESEAAKELALAQLQRISTLPLARQAARLTGALARRGYPPDVVREAVAAVLPPEGWD
jgi:regulatory protein